MASNVIAPTELIARIAVALAGPAPTNALPTVPAAIATVIPIALTFNITRPRITTGSVAPARGTTTIPHKARRINKCRACAAVQRASTDIRQRLCTSVVAIWPRQPDPGAIRGTQHRLAALNKARAS